MVKSSWKKKPTKNNWLIQSFLGEHGITPQLGGREDQKISEEN